MFWRTKYEVKELIQEALKAEREAEQSVKDSELAQLELREGMDDVAPIAAEVWARLAGRPAKYGLELVVEVLCAAEHVRKQKVGK